ncbi:dullard-like phosphatase domain-containing protein [Sodiomyces alkalinus F11]|uniref:Dullard-like phosphatase domain-containing protein n=1 Tax=Sodiomyces alkalinus (strain CBS 110278 / VKM F-3762 / F11) TaxID=1314773 RepID=A0A3N2Q421_SODAK|nr:dullard-like phosphatase domain-containing protein [Sodiomyces alkalinus F11]ROT41500.1 dullard-like phosphatase domain-containing protein [Sodiomyces alkalinus F11]
MSPGSHIFPMNSLNILSSRVSPPPSPGPSRSNSIASFGLAVEAEQPSQTGCGEDLEQTMDGQTGDDALADNRAEDTHQAQTGTDSHVPVMVSEETPLLGGSSEPSLRSSPWHTAPRRIAASFIDSLRWVLSTLTAPGVYLIACLYDGAGSFAPFTQLNRLFGGQDSSQKLGVESTEDSEKTGHSVSRQTTSLPSESESEKDSTRDHRHARSKSLHSSEEAAHSRSSIRIKLHGEGGSRTKHRKTQSASPRTKGNDRTAVSEISAQLKSPTSPAGALTKYPQTPAPPRPLIPRRQPSYLNLEPTDRKHQKTLILDLDETLIHSMSKGGRMSTGHMVEVRLSQTYVGPGGQTTLGPQHPILYWVNKRPYCDDFLRRVCKWYNLVVFTASVQEYADPVIDWLESERKFFSARYYRQHCTFRQGAFIKDLSSVEPDLSKVMILDNSPLSYMFHQDNAIPIQGWISDPTDNDLLHLIPLLEGLQYVSDVRAFLALRGGEDGQHMA